MTTTQRLPDNRRADAPSSDGIIGDLSSKSLISFGLDTNKTLLKKAWARLAENPD
ncbi:hypothetical protein AAG612_14055 [Citromicrobium bathyomarinum]|uniref:hypothetical protein n=1 Tax=Citromicrobium bathyomarinum TaxID=72174 RepID=UPI003159E560